MGTNQLTGVLSGVTLGQPTTHANMVVYPLHIPNGHKRAYTTLDEAIKTGTLKVVEVSEGGSVPNLKVQNTGPLPVLLVIGEELVGARQNRVLNTSLLVPANKEIVVPVSCVEQGRWAYTSRGFSSGDTSSHLRLRQTQVKNVTENLRRRAAYDANQGEVWQEVTRKIHTTGSLSDTSALHDVYQQTDKQIEGYMSALQKLPNAEGVIILINGKVVGADVFDHADTLRLLWPKLLRGYALDALEHQNAQPANQPPDDVQQFIKAAQEALDESYDSVGLGKDVRLSSDRITGSGLLWEDKVIHASLFGNKA